MENNTVMFWVEFLLSPKFDWLINIHFTLYELISIRHRSWRKTLAAEHILEQRVLSRFLGKT